MSNHLSMSNQQAIIGLIEQGWSQHRVARELELDRKTVRCVFRCCRQMVARKLWSRTFARPGLSLPSRMANLVNPSSSRKPRTPTSVWRRVREEYQQGAGSCAELARRHGLSAGAVSSRCKREQWRRAVTQLDQKLTQRLDQLTTAKADSLAERAARFRDRALAESEGWLDRIQQAKALVAENDTQALKELISAWQVPVQMGAKLLRLDETPVERPRILIGIVGDLREAMRSPRESTPINVATTIDGE